MHRDTKWPDSWYTSPVCQCLLHPAVSPVALAGCPSPEPSLLCHPPLRSPSLLAPTLKKGPPPQISVSNPRWPPTFFNWRGELMCNQLWSGWLPSRQADRRFSGERGWVWEKARWALRQKASSAATDVKKERTQWQDTLHTWFIRSMFSVLWFRQILWTVWDTEPDHLSGATMPYISPDNIWHIFYG